MTGLSADGYQVELDGDVVGMDVNIGDGNLLVLAKQVKGANQ